MSGLRISRSGSWQETTQVTRMESNGSVELFICSRPTRDAGGFAGQADEMYGNLYDVLKSEGARPEDVLTEKVFFSDVDSQFHDLRGIRHECYNGRPSSPEQVPATLFLHQPPCHPGRLCELQAYALYSTTDAGPGVRTINGAPGLASGKVIDHQGYRHLYLMNLTGGDGPGDGMDFSTQAWDMFRRAETLLEREGLSFKEVVRTWIYINNIERDYLAFNAVRTEFFEDRGVTRLPASTGIQGATYPKERGCAMDLYTVVERHPGERPLNLSIMHAPTLNEAPVYGSAFSRGMRVELADRVVLYISGTASIDTSGTVISVGDIEGQVNRMLLNVEELLTAQGARVSDLVTAITYLKSPDYLDTFFKVCRERGLPGDLLNTVSVADICRPEWLCEIEAVAVLGK